MLVDLIGLTVPDFSSIPLQRLDLVALGHVLLGVVVVSDARAAVLVVVLEFLEKVAPDLGARGVVEFVVAEGQVDARFEGLVELVDAVCGEEEDALEVVEGSEEDFCALAVELGEYVVCVCGLPETMLLRCRSFFERFSRYTSASSKRTIASQSFALRKYCSRLFSSSSGSCPRSAAVMFKRGLPVNSATDSRQ